jgi:hypothetical protein
VAAAWKAYLKSLAASPFYHFSITITLNYAHIWDVICLECGNAKNKLQVYTSVEVSDLVCLQCDACLSLLARSWHSGLKFRIERYSTCNLSVVVASVLGT